MGNIILAQGKEAEQTLAGSLAAGATQASVPSADTIFSLGELLFVSETDASEPEYLGAVNSVSATTVGFTFAVRAAKEAGAKLWRPATSLLCPGVRGVPTKRKSDPGVAVERSLGGTSYAVRVGEPRTTLELALESLTPVRESEVDAWIAGPLAGGLLPFSLISSARAISSVRLSGGEIVRTEEAGGRHSLRVPLILEAENQFT